MRNKPQRQATFCSSNTMENVHSSHQCLPCYFGTLNKLYWCVAITKLAGMLFTAYNQRHVVYDAKNDNNDITYESKRLHKIKPFKQDGVKRKCP